MIPPALREVCELVLQAVLHELEHDGDDRGEPPVPEDEGLAPVAHQVSHDEYVHFILDIVPGVSRVVRIIDQTGPAVILLGRLLSKILVHVPSQVKAYNEQKERFQDRP